MVFERNFKLIDRKFKELLLPTIGVTLAGNFAILVDAFLISFILGADYLSVVECVEPIALFSTVVFWTIGIGGAVSCSVARASFDEKRSNELFTVAIGSGIIISVAIMVISFLFFDSLLQLLCSSAALRPLVGQYLRFVLLMFPFATSMVIIVFY